MDALGRPAGHVVERQDRAVIATAWSGPTDYDHCPPDYDLWWRQYEKYTRHYVAKFVTSPGFFDDVVCEIRQRFIERDSLGVFSRDWQTRSETGQSRFRSYYIRFVITYARGKNRNYVRRAARELVIADAPLHDDDDQTLLDSLTPAAPAVVGQAVEFADLARGLRREVPDALLATLDALIAGAMSGTDLQVTELAAYLGCSRATASRHLSALRGHVARRPHLRVDLLNA